MPVWKVFYNKSKQGNVEKTDVGGEIQDICQELPVTSGHTKSFFSKIFGRFLNMAIIKDGWCLLHIRLCQCKFVNAKWVKIPSLAALHKLLIIWWTVN